MNLKIIFVIMMFVLSACASNPRIEDLSSSQRAEVSKVKVHKDNPYTQFDNLGVVTGLSCNRNKYQAQDVSESEAMEGVKIQTVSLGGNAVINYVCQKNSDTDWGNNCWASVKCIGDAIKSK